MDLWGSDFDGDGLLDLVTAKGGIVELWYNWGGGFDPILATARSGSLAWPMATATAMWTCWFPTVGPK